MRQASSRRSGTGPTVKRIGLPAALWHGPSCASPSRTKSTDGSGRSAKAASCCRTPTPGRPAGPRTGAAGPAPRTGAAARTRRCGRSTAAPSGSACSASSRRRRRTPGGRRAWSTSTRRRGCPAPCAPRAGRCAGAKRRQYASAACLDESTSTEAPETSAAASYTRAYQSAYSSTRARCAAGIRTDARRGMCRVRSTASRSARIRHTSTLCQPPNARCPTSRPELAVREVLAAGTPLVVGDVALPEVNDLAQRADAGKLAEQAFQQGGSAAAEPAEEQNAYQASPLSRFR